jgi:1,4-dihydroxy-2-naphthoyl-CoA synthase
MYTLKAAEFKPEHFGWEVKDRVATITLNRPERKNPLTFDSYAELRDTFHKLQYVDDVKLVIFTGAGGNEDDRRPGQGNAQLPATDHQRR